MRDEIVLPETKPETEWVRGRALQKVSPTGLHALLQTGWVMELDAWSEAGDRGRVGTEWRFRIAPPGEIIRPLVPDVAFVGYGRLPRDASRAEIDLPLVPPTAAVEILSPGDRRADLDDKVATYLRAGTDVVIVVDPRHDTVTAHDRDGFATAHGTFRHAALPGFELDVPAMFERARR